MAQPLAQVFVIVAETSFMQRADSEAEAAEKALARLAAIGDPVGIEHSLSAVLGPVTIPDKAGHAD